MKTIQLCVNCFANVPDDTDIDKCYIKVRWRDVPIEVIGEDSIRIADVHEYETVLVSEI